VVIPETHLRRQIPDPAAETEIIRQFIDAGYTVIDQKRYRELRYQWQEQLKDRKAAAAIGRRYGADLIVTGEAFSVRAPDTQGFVSCEARVEAHAILADTAQTVAAENLPAPGAARTEEVASKQALQNAARRVAPRLLDRLDRHVDKPVGTVQLEVARFEGFSAAAQFERSVRALPGIKSVDRASFDEGVLVLTVDAGGTAADTLAEKLETAAGLKPFRVSVQNVSKTRIRAVLK
jgi:hypothetical protein